eukprot:Tamp_08125.p1 GENE.Tamp_08125~~Tamp_08125.p1  ORF type:complete len:619 (+),score=31.91 Tamp_08125:192-1859(+)
MPRTPRTPGYRPSGSIREIGVRAKGETAWRPVNGAPPSTAGSFASYADFEGPYSHPGSPGLFSRAGSMGAYSLPNTAPPSPGRSLHSSWAGIPPPIPDVQGAELPYSDPDMLNVTQAYLKNPFAKDDARPERLAYTSVRSAKLTPGEIGTIAIQNPARYPMPGPPGYGYGYPPHMPGYGMPYRSPYRPVRRMRPGPRPMPMPMPMPPAPAPPPPPPVYKKKQGNSCRSVCLVVSGVIMFVCGVLIMALPYYAAKIPENAIKKACKASATTTCISGKAGTVRAVDLASYEYEMQCSADLKMSWGCACDSASSSCIDPEDFDCSDAPGDTYYLAMLFEWWDTGMWIIGGLGLGVCILFVAIPAFMGSVKGSSAVVGFSVCCGIFCAPFLFMGACFMTVAAAWKENDLAVYDTINNMCKADSGTCGQDVWCAALKEMSSGDEYQMTATVACAGVAFTVAGLTMLIGMFVCCCCKAPAPEEPVYVKPQPVMMTPQPVYAAPAPQPAMMMYEPMYEQPMIAYPEPMPLSYDYGYAPSGYDFGPAVDYGPGYVPARGQGQG